MSTAELQQQLAEIQQFILTSMGTEWRKDLDKGPAETFLGWLEVYLTRLANERNRIAGGLAGIEGRANRQLLCCIGIDLKHGNVPPDHYLKIFLGIRNLSETHARLDARKMFRAVVMAEKLCYRQQVDLKEDEFVVIIFPVCDLSYYNSQFIRITGKNEEELLIRQINDQRGAWMDLESDNLDKRLDHAFFWITNQKELDKMKETARRNELVTNQVVDLLGLSHIDITDKVRKDFCYLRLSATSITAYKPNATLADWDSDRTGFLSCYQKTATGHTFSITGFNNFYGGVEEKVFSSLKLKQKELKESKIWIFNSSTIPPLSPHVQDIIEEGVRRFMKN